MIRPIRRIARRAPAIGGARRGGPTLEIFNYNILKKKPDVAVNRPGFGHIAFAVNDAPSAREAVRIAVVVEVERKRKKASAESGHSMAI